MADGSAGSRRGALLSRGRIGKFVSVGAIGAACDTATLVFLVEVVGLLEELALLIGIEVAVLVMFLLNDRWTFAAAGGNDRRSILGRVARSHMVRAGGIVTQFVVFVIIYRLLFVSFPVLSIDGWLLVAKGGGILAGLTVNYVFESLFTWRVHADG